MDFPEILVILVVALIFLGPERMLEVATQIGEMLRKVRQTWDELRYQLYLENLRAKQGSYLNQENSSEDGENPDAGTGTSENAPDGASERAPKQAD
ncbi:MAG: twin-arginine translocase TatA/TatE family subunit [Aquificaceae bacterium]